MLPVVLAVGDTTYLDYKQIIAKRDGYGPIGNGGNGLILHTNLAVEPLQGQSLGLLWQKLWHREAKAKLPTNETPKQKKVRTCAERKAARSKPFESKESYRWVEALKAVEKQLQAVEQQAQPTQQLQETLEQSEKLGSFIYLTEKEILPRYLTKCVKWNELESESGQLMTAA